MESSLLRHTLPVLLLLLAAIFGGCNQHVGGGANATAASSTAKPGPEESFDRIMESFRRKIEDTPVGFVVSGSGSRSMMTGSNKVTSKLIPPSGPDDHYRAVVTVDSQSRFSLHRSKTSTEDSEHDQKAGTQTKSPLDDKPDKLSIGILDPTLAGKSTKPAPETTKPASSDVTQAKEDVVARQQDEQHHKYELIYENGRWLLVTKTDPKTEKSIQFAFDQALSGQS